MQALHRTASATASLHLPTKNGSIAAHLSQNFPGQMMILLQRQAVIEPRPTQSIGTWQVSRSPLASRSSCGSTRDVAKAYRSRQQYRRGDHWFPTEVVSAAPISRLQSARLHVGSGRPWSSLNVVEASKTDTAKGRTRPAPLFSPLGRKRRKAIAHSHLCRPHHLGAQPGPVLWPATTKAKPHTDVRDEKIPH